MKTSLKIAHGRCLALVLAVGVAACFPKAGGVPAPLAPASVEAARGRWPEVSSESLAAGRELFVAKCNHCHGYPDLVATEEAKWPEIVERMGPRSHLGPAEVNLVLRFIQAARP
jgi:cytochrome c5